MNTCQCCGKKYQLDLIIPDNLWNSIRPKDKPEGGGLFCGTCIMKKIEDSFGYCIFKLDYGW